MLSRGGNFGQSSRKGGSWCLPGGKADYGETVEQAVVREVREETALECSDVRFLFYQNSLPYEAGGMHCLNLYFECAFSGTLALSDESSDFAWISEADLCRYDLVFRHGEGLLRYWTERGRR